MPSSAIPFRRRAWRRARRSRWRSDAASLEGSGRRPGRRCSFSIPRVSCGLLGPLPLKTLAVPRLALVLCDAGLGIVELLEESFGNDLHVDGAADVVFDLLAPIGAGLPGHRQLAGQVAEGLHDGVVETAAAITHFAECRNARSGVGHYPVERLVAPGVEDLCLGDDPLAVDAPVLVGHFLFLLRAASMFRQSSFISMSSRNSSSASLVRSADTEVSEKRFSMACLASPNLFMQQSSGRCPLNGDASPCPTSSLWSRRPSSRECSRCRRCGGPVLGSRNSGTACRQGRAGHSSAPGSAGGYRCCRSSRHARRSG